MKIFEGNTVKYQAYSHPFYAIHEHDVVMNEHDIISAAVVDSEWERDNAAIFDTLEEASAYVDRLIRNAPEATARRERVCPSVRFGYHKVVLHGAMFFVGEVEVDEDGDIVDYGEDLVERVSDRYVIPFSEVEEPGTLLALFREIPEKDRDDFDEESAFLDEDIKDYAKAHEEYACLILEKFGIEF